MFEYTITEENNYEALVEGYELAKAHYNEVEKRSSDMPFQMDLGLVYEYMKAGILFVYVARDPHGEMIGYFCNQLLPDPFTSQLVGKEFGIYLSPEYRGKGVFLDLVKAAEEGVRQRGARLQYVSFKEGHDFNIASKIGYSPTETVYQKLLEE